MGYNNCNIRYLLNTYYSFYCSSSINHFKQLQMKQEIYQSGFYFMLGLIIGVAITFSKPKVKSDLVKSHQNILGMKKGNKYRRYSHWTECVADYKKRISSRYTGGDYYSFLLRIKYAEDPNYIETLKQLI